MFTSISTLSHENAYDLVVVGSTPGGIAMAVRAAREGLSVLLTNYHPHPGGLLSSGLAVWDTLYEGHRSPLYDEARQAIFDYYHTTYGEDSEAYRNALPAKTGHSNGKFEAKVAEAIFRGMIEKESRLTFLTSVYPVSVDRTGAAVKSVTFKETHGPATVTVHAAIFADCTYEGDLMALARVPYAVGREPRSQYGEPHAGRIFMLNLPAEADPMDVQMKQELAAMNIRQMGGPQKVLDAPGTGAGDGWVQAFNYRTTLSAHPDNRLPVEKPEGYDPQVYAKLDYGSRVAPLPNHKVGWNRPQLVGLQTDYVEGDWARRQQVLDAHWKATLGLLYYLQHDAPLNESDRAYWRQYGVAKDEFADNGHRPYEIYVREARRLIGRSIYTEHDGRTAAGICRPPLHADSIAITEWYFDTHSCTKDRIPQSMEEGKMMLHQETLPGQISWRCLLPQGVDNLLVPVCLSASHVAWGGIRLEPTWMQLGESAALAAVQARRNQCAPADINVDELLRMAANRRIMLTFFNDVDVASPEAWVAAVQYFGTKGFFPTYNARANQPLTQATARAWAEVLRQMATPEFNPTAAAALVAKAEQAESPVADKGEIRQLVGASHPTPLTRGQACQLLFDCAH